MARTPKEPLVVRTATENAAIEGAKDLFLLPFRLIAAPFWLIPRAIEYRRKRRLERERQEWKAARRRALRDMWSRGR